jgi:hypothetical protein
MPPYHENASMAQQRKLFALANEGKVSMADAKGRARASKGKSLPRYVSKSRSASKGGR